MEKICAKVCCFTMIAPEKMVSAFVVAQTAACMFSFFACCTLENLVKRLENFQSMCVKIQAAYSTKDYRNDSEKYLYSFNTEYYGIHHIKKACNYVRSFSHYHSASRQYLICKYFSKKLYKFLSIKFPCRKILRKNYS